jgi:hypothetical protein
MYIKSRNLPVPVGHMESYTGMMDPTKVLYKIDITFKEYLPGVGFS